jgi:Na+-translocating ferredoxin:NAD+ oxidoreductase RnfC subunit
MTIKDIENLGIVGAGGGGFPAHVKLQSRPEFLIMNAVECEPLLHKDKEILLHHADRVMEGFRIAMSLTSAGEGIIGIKAKHKTLIGHLRPKLSERMRIEPVGDFYPAGDEVTLIHLTTGRLVQPGALPVSVGCLVQNVETLFNLATDEPVTDKWLTVAGAVEHPATVKVPVGTSFRDVLSHFRITAPSFVIRSGGLMMGSLEKNSDSVVTKTTGGLIVLPADHPCAVTYGRYAAEQSIVRMAKAACDQCSFCTELCPRYLLGHPVRPETAMRNLMFSREDSEMLHPGNAFCCECNLCTLYACPEGLDPKGAAVIEKRTAHVKNIRWEGRPVRSHPMMPYRKIPIARLKLRLGVADFRDAGPFVSIPIRPDRVRIPLQQHAGKPAVAVCHRGDSVSRGMLIGRADGSVSANVHASIDGRVTDVNTSEIIIQRNV